MHRYVADHDKEEGAEKEARRKREERTYLAENGAAQLGLDKKGFKHFSFHISTGGGANLLVDFSVERRYAAWFRAPHGKQNKRSSSLRGKS